MRRSFALLAVCLAAPAAAQEGGASCLFDTACPEGAPPAVAAVTGPAAAPSAAEAAVLEAQRGTLDLANRAPRAPRKTGAGVWAGAVNGAEEGATLGFFAVISPAAALLSEGFGRRMSRAYDGARDGNDWAGFYTAAGIALGAVLYVPALAAGLVGGIFGTPAGAVSEAVAPGSTEDWDAERWLFD